MASVCIVVSVFTSLVSVVWGEGFLGGKRAGHHSISIEARSRAFQAAFGAVLGCGGSVDSAELDQIQKTLAPMWSAVPKNQNGRVEWRLVRYMAHRYFMQQSSWMIRGFEPTRQLNESHMGTADILGVHTPELADAVMKGQLSQHGYSLQDTAALVSAIQHLIFDSESSLLEKVYDVNGRSPKTELNRTGMKTLLEDYMLHWMIGDDQESIDMLKESQALIEETIPHWQSITGLVDGTLKSMEYKSVKSMELGKMDSTVEGRYSFDVAHQAAGNIARNFASFWETECQAIKSTLVSMDPSGTGRVRLSDFYGSNMDGEWHFAESEAYLRELGALDETSSWKGKQVIIPNYMQAASNCIVSTSHYLVCCVNECESILNDVETAVGSPLAHAHDVLSVIRNMSSFDNMPPKLDDVLKAQLERVAENYDGRVPLHGRLFAQWLHYVFPRECPFPHKAGKSSSQTPWEYGDMFIASDEEKTAHIMKDSTNSTTAMHGEELHWMSQWSEEEELIADYGLHLRAPWEGKSWMTQAFVFLSIIGLISGGVLHCSSRVPGKMSYSGAVDKAHFV